MTRTELQDICFGLDFGHDTNWVDRALLPCRARFVDLASMAII